MQNILTVHLEIMKKAREKIQETGINIYNDAKRERRDEFLMISKIN